MSILWQAIYEVKRTKDDDVAFLAFITHDADSLVRVQSSVSLADFIVQAGLPDHANEDLRKISNCDNDFREACKMDSHDRLV